MNWKIFFLFGLVLCLSAFEFSGSLDPGPPDETCDQNAYPDFGFDLASYESLPTSTETVPTPSEDLLSTYAQSNLLNRPSATIASAGMHAARDKIERPEMTVSMELLEAIIYVQESSVPPDIL